MDTIETVNHTETPDPLARPTTLPRERTPQAFYHVLVTRPDGHALLARLAAGKPDAPVADDDEQR